MAVLFKPMSEQQSAGDFLPWLQDTLTSLQGKRDADVPCGDCVACCTSSYFIHIKPTDTQTLERVPKDIVFPAPRLPKGHFLLGYNEKGHCPMFEDGKCSIYEYRPQTCRQYDCRVFAATGLQANEKDKSKIANQAKAWTFETLDNESSAALQAVRAAATFLRTYTSHFPKGFVPSNTTQQAVLAIRLYAVFQCFPEPNNDKNIHKVVQACISEAQH